METAFSILGCFLGTTMPQRREPVWRRGIIKDLSGDVLIHSGAIKAEKISYQINNIVSLEVCACDNHKESFAISIVISIISGFVFDNIIGSFGLLFAVAAFCVAFFLLAKSCYELHVLTNAASTFRIKAKSEDFLQRIKYALEHSMRSPDAVNCRINFKNQTLDELGEGGIQGVSNDCLNLVHGAHKNSHTYGSHELHDI